MLHPRHHFLADITAFGEIDAAELIHVGLMREGVAVTEISAAPRHAKRDAVRFIVARIDQYRAELGCRFGGTMRWHQHAKPERRQPRIGIAQSVICRAAAVPRRETPSISDKSSIMTLARNL